MCRPLRGSGTMNATLCSDNMDKKSRDILEGIAAGQSCEEILQRDSSLTYHDIFHVVTGSPTTFWRKVAPKRTGKAWGAAPTFVRKPLVRRND